MKRSIGGPTEYYDHLWRVYESVWVRRAEPLQLLSSHLLIMVVFFRKTRMTRNTLDTYLKRSEQRTSTHYTANHFNYGILIGSRHYNLCSFSLMLIKMRVIHLRKISIEQEKKRSRNDHSKKTIRFIQISFVGVRFKASNPLSMDFCPALPKSKEKKMLDRMEKKTNSHISKFFVSVCVFLYNYREPQY